MSRVKTGHVLQVREKGPNYITLGSAMVQGERHLIVTKNGNIRLDGKAKKPGKNPQNRRRTAPMKLYAFKPSQIHRVHQQRDVDLSSVFNANFGAVEAPEELTVRNTRVGINSDAEVLPHVN